MLKSRWSATTLAVAMVAIVACSDAVAPVVYGDDDVSLDIASSAGDAIATAIEAMAGNENATTLQSVSPIEGTPVSIVFDRDVTCFDAAQAILAGCNPLDAVRKIVTQLSVAGNRSGSHARGKRTVTWNGVVHRLSNDTVIRNFSSTSPSVELSRTHHDVIIGNDTTTFFDGVNSRVVMESSVDSVRGVTWNVPRFRNPFPASGTIVRVATVRIGVNGQTREVTRTTTVILPPDPDGNVQLNVSDGTRCNLNIVTHRITLCNR